MHAMPGIPLLDYDKPPPGYAIEEDSSDPPSGKHGAYLRDAADKETLWGSEWTTWAGACAAAWTHARTNNDPLGTMRCGPLGLYVTFGPGLPQFLSRTDIWVYHDRRRALAIDISDQVGDTAQASDMLAKAITLTNAECEDVERYAALSFPRSVDMPTPLRRVLGMTAP
jgi:hypothetical protein